MRKPFLQLTSIQPPWSHYLAMNRSICHRRKTIFEWHMLYVAGSETTVKSCHKADMLCSIPEELNEVAKLLMMICDSRPAWSNALQMPAPSQWSKIEEPSVCCQASTWLFVLSVLYNEAGLEHFKKRILLSMHVLYNGSSWENAESAIKEF